MPFEGRLKAIKRPLNKPLKGWPSTNHGLARCVRAAAAGAAAADVCGGQHVHGLARCVRAVAAAGAAAAAVFGGQLVQEDDVLGAVG